MQFPRADRYLYGLVRLGVDLLRGEQTRSGQPGISTASIGWVMTPDRYRAILDVVQDSLDEPETRGEELAGRAFLSRFHFDRLVAAAVGEPPGAFRRRLLLERAAHRLSVTCDQVIEVGLDAGYASPEAFARAFGRAYGCSPSHYRALRRTDHQLSAPSGIHFHPPGGLRLPTQSRSTAMDMPVRMFDHHVELVGQILDRCDGLAAATLDRPITLSVPSIDADLTLRGQATRLVGQLEMWVAALEGATRTPTGGSVTPSGLRDRLGAAAPRFRELVITPILQGRGAETFIDASCDPPETFSYAGVLAHVLTFSAVRRTLAIGALEGAGVDDLGCGDPMAFVGGQGADASTIHRQFA